MRVAVDARELCGRPTGVGRYLSGLLDAWAASDRARRHEWTLVAHAPIPGAERWPAVARIVPGSGGTYWEQFTLPRALGAERPDLFFAPGYTAPLTVGSPLVLTIHDVSFFAHPEWFSFREGARRRMLTAWSARRAKTVITDSDFSKSEIARFIGVNNVRTIPLGLQRAHAGSPAADRPGDRAMVLRQVHIRAAPGASPDRGVRWRVRGSARHARIVGENRARGIDLDALRRRSAHAVASPSDRMWTRPRWRSCIGGVRVCVPLDTRLRTTPLEALAEGAAGGARHGDRGRPAARRRDTCRPRRTTRPSRRRSRSC